MKRNKNKRVKRMLTRVRKQKRLSLRRVARFKMKETIMQNIRCSKLNKASLHIYFPLFKAKDYDPL